LRWRLKEIELAKKIKIPIIIGRRVFLAKKKGGRRRKTFYLLFF